MAVAVALAVALFTAVGAGTAAAQPSKYVYFVRLVPTPLEHDALTRVNTDGTEPKVIAEIAAPFEPTGLAVDGTYIYWANHGGNTISREKLDGTGLITEFIKGASGPTQIAIDRSHIYWAHGLGIGRANLDGTGVNQSFIPLSVSTPVGVAVNREHIYFTLASSIPAIGRANLDGSGKTESFITKTSAVPGQIAVDDSHIYWINESDKAIGRANIDGTGVNQKFIPGPPVTYGGVALDGEYLYLDAVVQEFPERVTAISRDKLDLTASSGVVPNAGRRLSMLAVSAEAPTAESKPASGLAQTGATLNGSVTPNGREVSECLFEYGITPSYGSSAPCTQAPGTGVSPVAVSAALAGLVANTEYHFRISAANIGGVSRGSDETFKTAAKLTQSITFSSTPPGNATVGGPQYTVAAEASSKLAVSFSIDPPSSSVCTISGATVSFVGSGTCTIDANQAGNGEYEAAPQVQQSFAVAPAAPPPTVTKLKPAIGPVGGGTTVTISGTNFSGVKSVKFGATNATSFTLQTIKGVTSISAVAPAEPPGKVDVTVTTPGGTSAISTKDRFSFLPTVTGLSPASGTTAGGTAVTVTGAGFALGKVATVLKFGTKKGTAVNCTSPTTCTVVSPVHEVGTVDVKATVNKVSSATNAPADQFTYSAAALLSRRTLNSESGLLGAATTAAFPGL